jgi:hypothetical protein
MNVKKVPLVALCDTKHKYVGKHNKSVVLMRKCRRCKGKRENFSREIQNPLRNVES